MGRRNYESSIFQKRAEDRGERILCGKVIMLPAGEYESFTNHLMHKHDFIRENVDFMYEKDGVRHCLLVTGEGMEEGVLVESEGSSYARYFAFVPSVSGILEQEQAVKETQTLSMIKESGQEEQAGMVLS